MSSPDWELVTKSKKQKNMDKKVEAHAEKKRIEALGPKLEDILPAHQINSLFGIQSSTGTDNLWPANSTSAIIKPKPSPKKHSKSKENEIPKKQQHPKGPSKPRSLESALRSLKPCDFLTQLQQMKISCPGSELLWLKGIAMYINYELPFACDPVFLGKSIHYPSNMLTPEFKRAVDSFLHSIGEQNLAYFFHSLVDSMATELLKNLPIVGYKVLLQLVAQNYPQICSGQMAKTALLRNQYQNRSNIGLSILWVVGQGGYKEIMEGIKVWQNLMVPCIDLKNYTRFVIEYIAKVLNSAENLDVSVQQIDFFTTFNALKFKYNNIPKELQDSLFESSQVLLTKYIQSISQPSNLFITLFRDIQIVENNYIELNGCLNCLLKKGSDSLKTWKINYKNHILPSLLLFKKIERADEAAELLTTPEFCQFILYCRQCNTELAMATNRDANLDALINVVENVADKSAQLKKKQSAEQKKKCGCCKWVLGSILLIALIGGVLAYDTNVNGKGVFERSATGKVLKNAGVLPHVERAWYVSMSTSARGYKWAEQHVPAYAKPAGKLICDLYKLFCNTACNAFDVVRQQTNAKLPIAAKYLEQYVPGLPKKIETASVSVKNVVVDIFSKSLAFVKTQVLVGHLSPESLSKALNQTQNIALEYYYTFHKKVDAYAKLK